MRDDLVEALCQARCFVPGVRWDDGLTEGQARIERMIAEKQASLVAEACAEIAETKKSNNHSPEWNGTVQVVADAIRQLGAKP